MGGSGSGEGEGGEVEACSARRAVERSEASADNN